MSAARTREAGDRLIAAARLVIPDLDDRIVYRSEASPRTFARYAWASNGAIYGVRSVVDAPSPRRAEPLHAYSGTLAS